MMYQLFAGLFSEGTTDDRFFQSIVHRTLEDIVFNEARGQFEIEVSIIKIDKTGKKFKEQVLEASKKGIERFGISLFYIHRDADSNSSEDTLNNLINPALKFLEEQVDADICKNLIPIVPIQETEAWMLADKIIFKHQIGAANKSNSELEIENSPESMTDPKRKIENAIRIATKHLMKKRRRHLSISDLYLPLGQLIELESLKKLSSYQQFQNDTRKALKRLNLLS